MATESTALSNEPGSAAKSNPAAAAERPPASERRAPLPRDTVVTQPETDAAFGFEPHDTIPAPPWLGDDDAPEA
jgi:hypothetical protein